jgi:glycosyltransferase involved in cell wall biosynthesis
MGSAASKDLKHIGINAHLLSGQQGYRRAGIHHYISQLLNNLPQDNGQFEVTIFSNNSDDLTNWPASKIVPSRWRTNNPLFRIAWEQIAWPSITTNRELDLLHSMAFVTPVISPCPTIVTVYDLSFIYFPEQYPLLRRIYLTNLTRRSCQKSKRIVTISEAGRQDVHRQFGIALDKIEVVPPGVDSNFVPLSESEVSAFRERQQLPGQFVLHVGTLQPRKNLPILMEAMAQIKRPEITLVLVGGKGWYYEEIFTRVRQLGLENQVRFTGYVSEVDLPLWYNAASMLVFPSFYEGFGMPALEAMACGTPVVVANNSSLPEVVDEAGRLFEPEDIQALAEHIVTVLDDQEIAVTMRQKGMNRAKNYSWSESGQKLNSIYLSALAES